MASNTTAATVTLKHLAADLAETHEMSKKQAEALLDQWVGLMTEHLGKGDRVRLGNLGVMVVRERPARTGRHPGTGDTIEIGASRRVAFRPSKELVFALGPLPGEEGTDPPLPGDPGMTRQLLFAARRTVSSARSAP